MPPGRVLGLIAGRRREPGRPRACSGRMSQSSRLIGSCVPWVALSNVEGKHTRSSMAAGRARESHLPRTCLRLPARELAGSARGPTRCRLRWGHALPLAPVIAVRRMLGNWRLLTSVAIGTVVAATIIASTAIYADAIRDLGLDYALDASRPRRRSTWWRRRTQWWWTAPRTSRHAIGWTEWSRTSSGGPRDRTSAR